MLLHLVLLTAIGSIVVDAATCSLTGDFADGATITPPAPASGSNLGDLTTYSIDLGNYDTCQWTFQCADPTQFVHITSITTTDYYGNLQVRDSTGKFLGYIQRGTNTWGTTTRQLLPPGGVNLKWITGGYVTTITVVAQCADLPAQCDSAIYNSYPVQTPGGPAVLTSYPGTIISDADGVGTSLYAYGGNKCAWQIQCPPNYAVEAQIDMSIYGSDGVNFWDPGATFPYSLSNTYQSFKLMFNSPLSVWYNSTVKVGTSGGSGLSIAYTCVPDQRCASSATLTNYGGYTVAPAGNTRTYITIDSPWYSNQDCSWSLQCPTNWALAVLSLTTTNTPYPFQTVNGVKTEIASTFQSGFLTYGSMNSVDFVGSDSMILSFTTPSTYLTPGSTSRGSFTLSFYCFQTQCSIPSGTYDGATAGSFTAPAMNNMNCSWTFVCSNGFAPQLVALSSGGLGYGDSLAIYEASGTQRAYFAYTGLGLNIPGTYGDNSMGLFPKPSYTITVHTDSSYPGNPITVNYNCVNWQSQCTANYTADSSGAAKILSSTSGTVYLVYPAQAAYYNNERCKWSIACSGSSFVYVTSLTVRAAQGDALSITDGSSNQFTYTGSSTTLQNSFFGAPLYVEFNSDASFVGNGFRFSYLCSPQQCSATDTQFTKTALTGTIKSDSDGFGAALYANQENCVWTIQCPSGWKVAITSVKAQIYDTSDTIQFFDAGAGSPAYTWTGSVDLSGAAALNFRNVDSVQVKFITNAYDSGNSNYGNNGFTLIYACYRSQCSSPNQTTFPYTWYPGTIKTDTDSYNTGVYAMNNERCQWTIECPSGSYVRITSLQGISVGYGDTLTFINGLGGTATYSNEHFTQSGQTYTSNRVVVNWWTDESGNSPGAEFSYNCVDNTNQALAARAYVPTGLCSGTTDNCGGISTECDSLTSRCTNPSDPCYAVKLACQRVLATCNSVATECTTQSSAFCPYSILI